LTESE
jgi:hypothetical protein